MDAIRSILVGCSNLEEPDYLAAQRVYIHSDLTFGYWHTKWAYQFTNSSLSLEW